MLDLRKIGVGVAAVAAFAGVMSWSWALAVAPKGAQPPPGGENLNEVIEITRAQMRIVEGLGWLAALMIVVFAILIYALQSGARALATTDDAKARYYALPFGVPEGTIRGAVSILIIVLGIAVLTVQRILGVDSSEAIASFVGAVIAFYFVTREQAQTRGALEDSAVALRAATREVHDAANTVTFSGASAAERSTQTRSLDWRWLADLVEPTVHAELQREQPDIDLSLPLRSSSNNLSDAQLVAVVARAAPTLSQRQWHSIAYRAASQNAEELSAEIAFEIERSRSDNRTPALKVTRDLVRAWVQESFKATLITLRRLEPDDEIDLNASIGEDGYNLTVHQRTSLFGRGVRYAQDKIDPTPKDIDRKISARALAEAAKGTMGDQIQTLTGKIWPLVNPKKSEGAGA